MANQANNKTPIIDFHLQQYASVRKEIEEFIRETRILERYAIIGTTAVWVWLLTHNFTTTTIKNTPKIVWWIPSLLVFLCAIRSLVLLKGILKASRYIRHMEKVFFYSEEIPGWETFVVKEKQVFIKWSAIFYWLLMLSITVAVPFFI